MILEARGYAAHAVSARKGKRNAPASQRFCDRIRAICSKLYVENGRINTGRRSKQKPALQVVSPTSEAVT